MSPVIIHPQNRSLVGIAGGKDSLVSFELLKKAGKEIIMEHWAGDGDVIALIQKILDKADELVGSGVFRRFKGK